jgi:hypothetical protein
MLAILMIIGFPIFIGIELILMALGVVSASIVGFFCGPIAIVSNNSALQNPCCCVLCPLLMVIGAILGVFGGLGYSFYFCIQLIRAYCLLLASLLF